MSHHRLQDFIVWLPLSRVCSTVAAPHGWLNQMPSDLGSTEMDNMKMCWAKGQTNPWATKPLLTASAMINSCITSLLHRVCTTEHIWKGTHSLTFIVKFKQNSTTTKTKTHQIISTQQHCPQAPRSHLYDLRCPKSTQQSLLTSDPPQIPSEQDCWKEVKTWKGYPFSPVCDNKLITNKI